MEESKDELDKQKSEEILQKEELKAIKVDSKVELIEEKKQDELDEKTQAILLKFKLLLEKQNLPPIK